MAEPQNPYFVGRQAELARFSHLLVAGDPLLIFNVYGCSGIGKTWFLEECRNLCDAAQVLFAYLSPRHVNDAPSSLLAGWAMRLDLPGEWPAEADFDQLLPRFVSALQASEAPVVVLMLDNYDQMLRFDPQVRHLIRILAGYEAPISSALTLTKDQKSPCFIFVIGSERPLTNYWPLSPHYRRPLQAAQLHDLTFQQTCDYLARIGVPEEYHRPLFRWTQGYPLALALAATLDAWPEADRGTKAPKRAFIEELLSAEDREQLVQEILERAMRGLADEALRAEVIGILRASALVRRFDQSLLAAMVGQEALPDPLFDRVTSLSMVIERKLSGKPRTFALHDALRKALLQDANARGLEDRLNEYRRRALVCYTLQQSRLEPTQELAEWGLDILFLHSNPLIHYMFFGGPFTLLSTGPASFAELDAALEPLMRQNPLYEAIGFAGEPLERLIQETRDWLALGREQHGKISRYFQVVRRSDAPGAGPGEGHIAGFVLNVPATETTLPLLRRDTVGLVYERSVGPIEVDERCYFSLRLVADDWGAQSALIRTTFVQVARQVFDILVVATPWPEINLLVKELGFDTLMQDIEHDGHKYAVSRLDVTQHGGLVKWLLQLVRQDLGLSDVDTGAHRRGTGGARLNSTPRLWEDWERFKQVLREALEGLHGPFDLLAKSPLVDDFNLIGQNATDWDRHEALARALKEVVRSLYVETKPGDEKSHFDVLNVTYGVMGEHYQRYRKRGKGPTIRKIVKELGMGTGSYYARRDKALDILAREFCTMYHPGSER